MKPSLLLIEDDHDVRETLLELLPSSEYQVYSAPGGNEGIAVFEEKKPSIVITDILMPDREGISVIVEIKKINPKTKIIAISGGGQFNKHDVLKIAEHIGADKVLAKPFSHEELNKLIKELEE